jgi:hypothetical protein
VPGDVGPISRVIAAVRAHAKAIGFVWRVLPILPSAPIDWVTPSPVVERIRYPTPSGDVDADLYRPPGQGPHPAMVLCLGVVPFGVDHPQIPRLEAALARFGFIALIHWSPEMRDRRLVPEDTEGVALAYDWLLRRPDVDASRSGLFGTCVGGSFALLAAAHPLIRERVAFVGAFAPYSSMWTFARDIASGTRSDGGPSRAWAVDPLTRDVFVRSVTDVLDPSEAARLRDAYPAELAGVDLAALSADGRAIHALLAASDRGAAELALSRLPDALRARLDAMSPLQYIAELKAPLIVFGHDRDDLVVPVDESRRLARALSGRAGVKYTEYGMFQHADPTKRKLSPLRLVIELRKFYLSLYPIFRQSISRRGPPERTDDERRRAGLARVIMQVGGCKREAMLIRYIGKYDEAELQAFPQCRSEIPTPRCVTTDPHPADPCL